MEQLREKACLVGFGFSDPRFYEFARSNWRLFHAYFSLSPDIVSLAQSEGIPADIMFPSIHTWFHNLYRYNYYSSNYDVIHLGNIADHPDSALRRHVLSSLRSAGLSVLRGYAIINSSIRT